MLLKLLQVWHLAELLCWVLPLIQQLTNLQSLSWMQTQPVQFPILLNITLDGAHAGAALDYGIISAANVKPLISTQHRLRLRLVAADKNTVDVIFANATTINISGNVYADIDGDKLDGVVQIIDACKHSRFVAVDVDDSIAVKITGTAKADAYHRW